MRPYFSNLALTAAIVRPCAAASSCSAAGIECGVCFPIYWNSKAQTSRRRATEANGVLRKMLKPVQRICYCSHVGGWGQTLFAKAEELGLEAVIATKAASPWRGGRAPNWMKDQDSHGRQWTKSE